MARSKGQKESASVNALRNIAGIACRLEQHLSDAIGVARSAVEGTADEKLDIRMGALYLLWHKLELIQAAHAQIAYICPPYMRIEDTEGRQS